MHEEDEEEKEEEVVVLLKGDGKCGDGGCWERDTVSKATSGGTTSLHTF